MAVIDLTLDSFKVPAIDGYTPPFGTMVTRTEANKGGLSTVEVNSNVMMPFANMRPKVVTEDSSTTAVEYDAKIVFPSSLASGCTLTLGNGAYEGCELQIHNYSSINCTLNKATWSVVLPGGVSTKLIWTGTEWQINDGANIGDIKPSALANIDPGWEECKGQEISRSVYARLFHEFSTQTYDDDPTHTLLSRYGDGDGSTTFNLPDYRECALVGIGSNGTFIIDNTNQAHEVHTLGEFKDDQLQKITGELYGMNQCNSIGITASGAFVAGHSGRIEYQGNDTSSYTGASFDSSRVTRGGTTTHGKQIGVTYLIKVL